MMAIKASIYDLIDKLDETENQDALCVDQDSSPVKLAMSDGAGGIGIYCKEWAEHLVKNQPKNPITNQEEALCWFNDLSKDFFNGLKNSLPIQSNFVSEKFYTEGSFATLLYVWYDEYTISYSGIGDTCLFYFKKIGTSYQIQLIAPIGKQNFLTEDPNLVNWKLSLENLIVSESFHYTPGDCIILCTDSLSRRIIYQLMLLDRDSTEKCLSTNIINSYNRDFLEHLRINKQLNDTSDFINYLKVLFSKPIKNYSKHLKYWIKRNELEKDDYSIIIIDL
jgi:hypothetical protein